MFSQEGRNSNDSSWLTPRVTRQKAQNTHMWWDKNNVCIREIASRCRMCWGICRNALNLSREMWKSQRNRIEHSIVVRIQIFEVCGNEFRRNLEVHTEHDAPLLADFRCGFVDIKMVKKKRITTMTAASRNETKMLNDIVCLHGENNRQWNIYKLDFRAALDCALAYLSRGATRICMMTMTLFFFLVSTLGDRRVEWRCCSMALHSWR